MASIILGNTGEKLGENLIGGFFAPTIGRYFGSFLGSVIDKQLFSGNDTSVAGIAYINHQSATYGNVIPEIYGQCVLLVI